MLEICYYVKEEAFIKALNEIEINLVHLNGRLHKKKRFEICDAQNNSDRGRIERWNRMVQESMERSVMKNSRTADFSQSSEVGHQNCPLGFL